MTVPRTLIKQRAAAIETGVSTDLRAGVLDCGPSQTRASLFKCTSTRRRKGWWSSNPRRINTPRYDFRGAPSSASGVNSAGTPSPDAQSASTAPSAGACLNMLLPTTRYTAPACQIPIPSSLHGSAVTQQCT